jgi:hypothetical protein
MEVDTDPWDITGVTATQRIYAAFTGLAPVAGNVNVHFQTAATGCAIIVDQITGIDRSGTAAAAFRQFDSATVVGTTLSVTLGALASSSNAAYSVTAHHSNELSTQGGSFSLLKSTKHTGPPFSLGLERRLLRVGRGDQSRHHHSIACTHRRQLHLHG